VAFLAGAFFLAPHDCFFVGAAFLVGDFLMLLVGDERVDLLLDEREPPLLREPLEKTSAVPSTRMIDRNSARQSFFMETSPL
jgi:hypothetical protein